MGEEVSSKSVKQTQVHSCFMSDTPCLFKNIAQTKLQQQAIYNLLSKCLKKSQILILSLFYLSVLRSTTALNLSILGNKQTNEETSHATQRYVTCSYSTAGEGPGERLGLIKRSCHFSVVTRPVPQINISHLTTLGSW